MRRIVALTTRDNIAAIKVMERAGMRVGTNPDATVIYPGAVGIIENEHLHAP